MTTGVELGYAYVSILPDTSRFGPEMRRSMNQAQQQAEQVGRNAGTAQGRAQRNAANRETQRGSGDAQQAGRRAGASWTSGFTSQMGTAVGSAMQNSVSQAMGPIMGSLAPLAMGFGAVGLAVAGVATVFSIYRNNAQQVEERSKAMRSKAIEVTAAYKEMAAQFAATGGVMTKGSMSAGFDYLTSRMDEVRESADRGTTLGEKILHWGNSLDRLFGTTNAEGDKANSMFDKIGDDQGMVEALDKTLEKLGIKQDAFFKTLAEGGPTADRYIAQLKDQGEQGERLAGHLDGWIAKQNEARVSAQNATPGIASLSQAIQIFADTSSDATERYGALMGLLTESEGIGGSSALYDAIQAHDELLDRHRDLVNGPINMSDGFGGEQLLLDDGNKLATHYKNARTYRTLIKQELEAVAKIASENPGEMDSAFAGAEQVIEDFGRKIGLTTGEIETLKRSMNFDKDTILLTIETQGMDETQTLLTTLATKMGQLGTTKVDLPVGVEVSEDAKKIIEGELGGTVGEMDPVTKVVSVEIPADKKQALDDLVEQAKEAAKEHKTTVKVEGVDKAKSDIGSVKTELDNLPAEKQIQIQVNSNGTGNIGSPSGVPHRAQGGPMYGPGTETSDSIPALLSAGEHVLTARDVRNLGGHQGVYALRAAAGRMPMKFATGGAVPTGIQEALEAARAMEGHTYSWGGIGPSNFDCSGFVGFLQQVAMGMGRVVKRLYTTYSILDGATAGLESGLGPTGTWFRVGVSQEHMAATIGGLAVESGGAHGTSGVGGGRAGAEHSQFPYKYHLPNELLAGYLGQAGGGPSYVTGGSVVTWTDADQRELEAAMDAVTKAKEDRNKVFDNVNSTDAQKRAADRAVADAEDRVVKKQQRKDDAAAGKVEGGQRVAPQAPELEKKFTEDEKTRSKLLAAVESANEARNRVYDTPGATQNQRDQADIALQEAIEELENGGHKYSVPTTLRGAAKEFGGIFGEVIFDAFQEQLEDAVGFKSRWWDVTDSFAGALLAEDTDTGKMAKQALGNVITSSRDEIMGQLGYTPKTGEPIPEWVEKLKPKVYDNGGWLEPGGMAVNLSNRPEPIFNSPAQLAKFAGALAPAANSGVSLEDLASVLSNRPNVNINGYDFKTALNQYQMEQRRHAAGFRRR